MNKAAMNKEAKSSPGVDYPARHDNFERWFQTPLGRALLANQRQCVDHHLAGLTGARQLQIGISHRLPLASSTDFVQKIQTTPQWGSSLPDGVAVCDADELPFPNDSMDMVILHHTADFSRYPHQVLREAARVLRGGGQLLLLGFNPISLWGLRKLLSRNHNGPWGGRFLMRRRMEDWLNLLDFEIDSSNSYFFRPPVQNLAVIERSASSERLGGHRFLPVGAYYCILATKRVCAPIRLRSAWRQKKVIALPGTIIGSSRGCMRNSSQE